MSVVVQWSVARSLVILKESIEEVSYSIEKGYVYDSKSILSEIQEADVYVSDSDCDKEAETLYTIYCLNCEKVVRKIKSYCFLVVKNVWSVSKLWDKNNGN